VTIVIHGYIFLKEHLHQCSGCDPALEFEMRCSSHIQWARRKVAVTLKNDIFFQGRGLEESNKCNQVVFTDCSLFLIGPGALLLVVFHLFAFPVLVLWVELGKGKLSKLRC
jgi:hypothetical protein